MNKTTTIDDYISQFPTEVQTKLKEIRKTIKELAPKAAESISYGIAAFKLNDKPVVYFAGFKKHIGIYPFPSGVAAFEKEISQYKTSKGTIQLPLSEPVPLDLIKKIVKHRLENISGY